jgi:PAS domain S-box-containing protein
MRILFVTASPHHPLLQELARLGHETEVRSGAEEALGWGQVDVVVVESGWLASSARWLDELRIRARPDELCVLGLAPSHAEADLAPLLEAGVDEYLVPPFNPSEVKARLVLLERRRSARRRAQDQEASARGEMVRLSSIIQTQSEVALAGLELEPLMQLICERAQLLCGVEGAAVGLIEGDEFVYRVTSGFCNATRGFRLKLDKSLTGASVLRGEVMRTDDTEADVRVNVQATRAVGIRAMITVPLWRGHQPVGALNVSSPRPNVFGDRDVRTLELLAGLLGAAMGNAAEFDARQQLMAERTAALAALQEAQDRFTSFMNNSPALAYMKDETGRRVWANEPYRRFFQLDEAVDLTALKDSDLMPDAASEHVRRQDRTVFETGQPTASEAMIPSPSGAEHHWLTYRFLVRDGLGRKFLGGVSLDITQRKQAEQGLRRSEESFRALIEGLPEAIFVHRGGPLLYVNPAALGFLGRGASCVVGACLVDFVHPEDREAAAEVLGAPPGSCIPGTRELRFLRPDGRVMTAEVGYLGLVFDGQPATVIRATDLTERKQMQARLLLADRLAAVGTLAAGVAHEINNPLAFVLSNLSFLTEELQVLSRELPGGRLAEFEEVLREASDGAHRVRHIVRDLKTFSRVDEETPTAVNLQTVLESAITMARGELKLRARLVRDYAEVPMVEGSEGRFGQVFLNLLINAAQAIPRGVPERNEVRVCLRSDGERVIAEVRDTGIGIPQEVRARIFDPFFTTKPVGEGTGLGLSICHGIVTSFGGDITVESEPGQGSVFRVSFPVMRKRAEGETSAPITVRTLRPTG